MVLIRELEAVIGCFPMTGFWQIPTDLLPVFSQDGPLNEAESMSAFSNELRTARRTVRVCVLVAFVFVAIGINQLGSVHTGSFGRGLLGIIKELLYTYFGSTGLCVFWSALAVFPLFFARFIWRHTARTPNDRWYRN